MRRRLWFLGGLAVVAGMFAALLSVLNVVASEAWRDFAAWFSLFLTVLGLGYTVTQVTLAESAARAAEIAANAAREEARRRVSQFTAASAHRLINEVSGCLERQEWGKASMRLYDLADQAAQIAGGRAEWVQLVVGVREAAAKCAALESGRGKRATHAKWINLLTELRARLDAHFGPLST
ncbi:MAG TPA: hypothetical protein VFA26_10795 [Gemmataceae bacterium]|nr:hypothetical protein [Gemmataceae bacterium]